MKNTIVGLDLAKTFFHFVMMNSAGKVTRKKKVRRKQLIDVMSRSDGCLIAMEACAGAHHWGRLFRAMGHEVVLLPPQHVKAYLRGQKNDYNDALAIAEAAQHGAIRPVEVKTIQQQDEQAFLRIRRQLIAEKTRLINQVRGLLAEYGVVIAQGEAAFKRAIPVLLDNTEQALSGRFCELLSRQYRQWRWLVDELSWYDAQLASQAKTDETCIRLCEIPGFGPVVSTAFKAWVAGGKQFDKGRDASAALGLVPRQHSTGGKPILLGITKRGDGYVRSLIVHGARSVASRANKKEDPLSRWINQLIAARGFNKAVVALANKLVRIAWVIVARGDRYRPQTA